MGKRKLFVVRYDMLGPVPSRMVNKNGVPVTVWNTIEHAYRNKTDVVYSGRRYRVTSISRLFLTDGETALATLMLITDYN